VHPAKATGTSEVKVRTAQLEEDLDRPKTYDNTVLQRERRSLQGRNMDEHGSNVPPGHDNTTLRLGVSAMSEEQYPDVPADSVFPPRVSSSTSSATSSHISQTQLSSETILFARFKEFSFIWDRAWIGYVVDPCVMDIVKGYIEDFQDTSSFKIVAFEEFTSDPECMDGMINLPYHCHSC
jgi:hypothetical protein